MFSSRQIVEQIGRFKLTVKRASWPDRQWYYQIVDGWQVSSGGPYDSEKDARQAALQVIHDFTQVQR